jgi:hypothetical protein
VLGPLVRGNPDAAPEAQLNAEVAALFAVRPRLQTPARIALARLDGQRIAQPSDEEMTAWVALAGRLGAGFGEFVPLDPMMSELAAEAVSTAQGPDAVRRSGLADLRRGSALIKADYALVYQVASNSRESDNLLSVTDWTIIGLWITPSRNVEGKALAQAALIDVRTGLPLGTATAQAERRGLARATDAYQRSAQEADAAALEAVQKLTEEVETLAAQLLAESAADRRSIAD